MSQGVNRQQVLQYAGGSAISRQGGKVSLQLIELWCRSATRWPTDTRLGAIAGSTQKPRKPHRHFAEQRRDAVPPSTTAKDVCRQLGELEEPAVKMHERPTYIGDCTIAARSKEYRFSLE
jgi:hypothetical protein